MRATVYLRIAQTSRGYRFAATAKPSGIPLTDQAANVLPTIEFGLALDLPAGAFDVPIVATVPIPDGALRAVLASEVEPVSAFDPENEAGS